MDQPKKKNQTLTYISVLALLASFVIVITFMIPRIETLRDLSAQVAAKQNELDLGRQKIEDLKRAVGLIKAANQEMTLLGIAIPTKEKSDEAVAELSAAATQAGVTIQSITVGAPAQGSAALTVTTSGGYSNTIAFMSAMEQNLRPATLSDYSFATSVSGNNISATFNLMFPFIEDAKTAAPSATSTPSVTSQKTEVTNAIGE